MFFAYILNMYDFSSVRGRNKRRKQSKVGKFKTDISADGNEQETKYEYDFSEVSNAKLIKLKQDIRRNAKEESRNNYLILLVVILILMILFQYLGVFNYIITEIL